MSDNPKNAEREMKKAIFISADCWLKVFDLLPPSQLGLGIALISRRFDRRVDEHFKTRRWALDKMEIRSKFGENGPKGMEIVGSNGEALPIPLNPLPNKVIGFGSISIDFFDYNVLTFLRHFHRFFAVCAIKLFIGSENVRISEFAVLIIWPLFKDNIRLMYLNPVAFHQMRQLAPSILCNCPSLQMLSLHYHILPEFPPDDSANASDGQAVAKWLFTPHPDNLPKQLVCFVNSAVEQQLLATLEQIKAAFSNASSPVQFRFMFYFRMPSLIDAVAPFERTNELTGERLTLSHDAEDDSVGEDEIVFLLIRCPIAADDEKKWKKEIYYLFNGRMNNKIDILIGGDGVDKSFLDDLPGPSGQQ